MALIVRSSAPRRAGERERRAAIDERDVRRQADQARLENRVLADQRAAEIEAVRRQEDAGAAQQADREQAAADATEHAQHHEAERSVEAAERAKLAAASDANQLEREAIAAEGRARRLEGDQ